MVLYQEGFEEGYKRGKQSGGRKNCNNEQHHFWLGNMAGILHGISMRSDIPEDVRKKAQNTVQSYELWLIEATN